MNNDNPIVSLGMLFSSLYTRQLALDADSHKRRMDILARTPVEYNYSETFLFFIPVRQNQFFQESILDNVPVRRIAIAINTHSAFTGSYIENPFWYQQIALRQLRKLKAGQPIVDLNAADNCRN